eukprot:Nk52_evm12s375 gene=Nk52_evmTU12s375
MGSLKTELLEFCIKNYIYFTLFAYLVGVAVIGTWPITQMWPRTYISENAFLPGRAQNHYLERIVDNNMLAHGLPEPDEPPNLLRLETTVQYYEREGRSFMEFLKRNLDNAHGIHVHNDTSEKNSIRPDLKLFRSKWEYNGLMVSQLDELYSPIELYTGTASLAPSRIPVSWLQAEMYDLGMDVYEQKFEMISPLTFPAHHKGSNVYGVSPAWRSDGCESLVVNVAFDDSSEKALNRSMFNIAFGLTLMRELSRENFFSKNLIFVVTEHGYIGMQAWLEAYHDTPTTAGIVADPVVAHRGVIIAGVVLDFPSREIDTHRVRFYGVNGKLLNLDILNVVKQLDSKGFMGRMLDFWPTFVDINNYLNSKSSILAPFGGFFGSDSFKLYVLAACKLGSMISALASGMPDGNHGLFFKYDIEVITLTGVDGGDPLQSMRFTGMFVEDVLRAFSNLMEKVHQSFWFYLIPNIGTYISIANYIPSVIAIVASLVVAAIALWNQTGDVSSSSNNYLPEHIAFAKRQRRPLFAVCIVASAIISGAIFYYSPLALLNQESEMSDTILMNLIVALDNRKVVLFTLYCISFVGSSILFIFLTSLVEFLLPRPNVSDEDFAQSPVELKEFESHPAFTNKEGELIVRIPNLAPSPDWILEKCFGLTFSAISIIAIASFNFSQGLILAVIISPALLMSRSAYVGNKVSPIRYVCQIMAWIVLSPPFVYVSTCFVTEFLRASIYRSNELHLTNLDWLVDPFSSLVQHHAVLSTWLLPLICTVYWPINLIFWHIITH